MAIAHPVPRPSWGSALRICCALPPQTPGGDPSRGDRSYPQLRRSRDEMWRRAWCKLDPGMAELLRETDLIDDESELAAERLARGTRLGRYELLLPIAKGGMARVWAARQHGQRGFTKLVAIKTILPHLARSGEFERMFLDEARIASMVHHPNVCEIYELGEEGRVLYLAMEWVMGESLAHVLRVSGSC